ncbi:MAG TPA: hypothetical protein VLX92_22570 [Kofleriaceae bacterium]|nr:hypothetical protein [Kofleriaceae bacterium]
MKWLLVSLTACGASVAPPTRATAPTTVERAARVRVFRTLVTRATSSRADRTTFTLAIDGDRATLVESEETADGVRSIEDADAAASWKLVSSRTYRGRSTAAGAAMLLDLETPGQQPLHLRCMSTTIVAASPGARRVQAGGCSDPSAWDPPATAAIPALVCGEATQPPEDSDDDDDDRLVFGDAPGLEHASQHGACAPSGGLRRIQR